jgi:hypothetical protein
MARLNQPAGLRRRHESTDGDPISTLLPERAASRAEPLSNCTWFSKETARVGGYDKQETGNRECETTRAKAAKPA